MLSNLIAYRPHLLTVSCCSKCASAHGLDYRSAIGGTFLTAPCPSCGLDRYLREYCLRSAPATTTSTESLNDH